MSEFMKVTGITYELHGEPVVVEIHAPSPMKPETLAAVAQLERTITGFVTGNAGGQVVEDDTEQSMWDTFHQIAAGEDLDDDQEPGAGDEVLS